MFGSPYLDFPRAVLSKFYVHSKDINKQKVPRDLIFLILYKMNDSGMFMWEAVKRFQQYFQCCLQYLTYDISSAKL